MRKAVTPLLGSVVTIALLLIATGRGPAQDTFLGEHQVFAQPVASCTSPGADNGAFGLLGPQLPAVGMAYRTNQGTFPSYLPTAEVQEAIDSSFSTWDNATSATLFANAGTTNARPGLKDGVNSVGFGRIRNGALAAAFMWANKKGALTEFDVLLSDRMAWATNVAGGGDCGGLPYAIDIRNIVTHEAGHAVGLADLTAPNDNAQTLFGYAAPGELFKRTLASGDQAGLTRLYGP